MLGFFFRNLMMFWNIHYKIVLSCYFILDIDTGKCKYITYNFLCIFYTETSISMRKVYTQNKNRKKKSNARSFI